MRFYLVLKYKGYMDIGFRTHGNELDPIFNTGLIRMKRKGKISGIRYYTMYCLFQLVK